MRAFMKIILLLSIILPLAAAPDDASSGFYFAPIITSGHFGITADNLPYYSETIPTAYVDLYPLKTEATRGFGVGGKLGIFWRPSNYERRHRIDFETQVDYHANEFAFMKFTEISPGDTCLARTEWGLNGINIVGRVRWSGEVGERWQPFVHFGYGLDILALKTATAIAHGTNVGAGMRVRLCNTYSFYFEFETSPLTSVELDFEDIDPVLEAALGTNRSAKIGLHPAYSMISVGFEFPVSFCRNCDKKGPGRGR